MGLFGKMRARAYNAGWEAGFEWGYELGLDHGEQSAEAKPDKALEELKEKYNGGERDAD